MKVTLYVTLSATAYVTPNEPLLTPDIPSNATSASRQQLRDQHAEEHRIFTNTVNMDDALKTQFLDAVEESYVRELQNHYTGYMGVMTQDLLEHLMDRYSTITAANIKANEARINEALDNSRPIGVFFQRINDVIQYADDGKTHSRRSKYYRRHFTPSTPQACIKRHASNGTRNPTTTKRGQISSAILTQIIIKYENNSVYRETPD